ncbi:MAG TPA: DinB family protein [Candidatus Methylomirabilis sp.]|jgi:hypothetical protein
MDQQAVAKNRERYDQAFALLDGVREKVMALLHSITQSEADRRPAEDEWSMGEIADHLAITERAYVAVVAHLAANATPHEFDYRDVAGNRPFRIEDTWDVAVTGRLATPSELLPTTGKPLAQLVRGLQDARAHSRQTLAPYRDQDLSVKFFVHPRLGTMTLYERMAQLAYHELKHLKQMERALARLPEARK